MTERLIHADMSMFEAANLVAEELQGTAYYLGAVLERLEGEGLDDDAEFCAVLDSLVFECERCGWWHEISEMGDRNDEKWVCESCTDEEELEDA